MEHKMCYDDALYSFTVNTRCAVTKILALIWFDVVRPQFDCYSTSNGRPIVGESKPNVVYQSGLDQPF